MAEVITATEFSTTFALQWKHFAWFLDAGASSSTGMPASVAAIREFPSPATETPEQGPNAKTPTPAPINAHDH
jgi:hypothetical protein